MMIEGVPSWRDVERRWTGKMEREGEKRKVYRILVGNLMERDNLEDLVVDGRTILKGILKT